MSLKKIAKLAGVSIGTVDRALHGRGRVAEATKEKVEAIAKQLDYKPNLVASALSRKKTATIAILIPDPKQDEYWAQAWSGIEPLITKVAKQGVQIKPYFYHLADQVDFDAHSKEILSSNVDGLILAPNDPERGTKLVQHCNRAKLPVVLFDTFLEGAKASFFGTDLKQSGRLCAHLLAPELKGGKLGVFHVDATSPKSRDMLEKEAGIQSYSTDNSLVIKVFDIDSDNSLEVQLEAAIAQGISACIVANSKTWVIGEYLKKHHLKDIKLIGFDLVESNRALLQEGWIQFLINQNPRLQAQKSLEALVNHLTLDEPLLPVEYLALEIVTKENLVEV